MRLSAGGRLGPYEVVGLLGAGGMGVVYRARDPRLAREVAVKVLPDEFSLDPGRLERFRREARAVAALDHPNILSVHDVGTEGGTPYVVFELLEGQTLRERLAGGPLPVRTALDLAVQIARGLGAAHRRGIVHRDIKPENLLVARGGLLKILDFGLAKALGGGDARRSTEETATATKDGGQPGTAAYMSPEQARGQPVDPRSDLFSLGVVVHEMLTGASPFHRDTPAETVVAILKEPPGPLPPAVVEGASGMGPVLARCLAKEPDDRFQSAADLEFALQQTLGSPGTVGAPRARAQGARPFRVAAALIALALVAGVASLFVGHGTAPRPTAFRKLTARAGFVASARFSPDGQTVLFSGTWAGHEMETLEQRLDALEPRALELPPGRVSGSAGGEVAIVMATGPFWQKNWPPGTLFRVPAQGGGARIVAEGITSADWARDASAFAIVRRDGGFDRLEFPSGRRVYSSPGTLTRPRISPDGRSVAFIEHPVRGETAARLGVVDDAGLVRFLTEGQRELWGMSWSPDGREVWVSGRVEESTGVSSLEAVTESGRKRLLLRLPGGPLRLLDVSPQGRALLAVDQWRWHTVGRLAGDDRERDLTFRDRTYLMDLSPDGRTILFSDVDTRQDRPTAFLRRAADPQPVRLDFGEPQSLSPDGSRLILFVRDPESLRVIPTGAGEAFTLPRGAIAHYFNSRWLPDGRRVLIAGQEKDRPKRLFLQEVPDGLPRPATPEGIMTMYPAISPDGKWVAAGLQQHGALQAAWPLGGGNPRPLRGLEPGDWVLRWSDDERFVFAYETGRAQPPWLIFRVDLETGQRAVWKELPPPGSSGVPLLTRIQVTPDGRWYGYTYTGIQSDLYLVTGLR
jgi:dipeptidyl aminopeptidase/acylaminoacyl peptidase